MSEIRCIKCSQKKLLSDFEWQKNRPNPRKVCKQCRHASRDLEKERVRHREYMRNRRKIDPDSVRKNWERSTYGVCKEDIGVKSCMICGSEKRLCIDHCHESGSVRGILCSACNHGLGHFKDNTEFLRSAIRYLDGPHFELNRDFYR